MKINTRENITVNGIKLGDWLYGNATGTWLSLPVHRIYVPAENWRRGCTNVDLVVLDDRGLLPDKMLLGETEYMRLALLLRDRKASDGTL